MANEPIFTTAEKIEHLEAENQERIQGLMTGSTGGLPVTFPPGAFEITKIVTYLEHLLDTYDDATLPNAKLAYLQVVNDELARIEGEARTAKITQGSGILQANGQTPNLQ